MVEEVPSKYKYLISQGWTPEEAEKYDVALSKRGMSPTEAFKYVKEGVEPKREVPSWMTTTKPKEPIDIDESDETYDEEMEEQHNLTPRKSLPREMLEDIETGAENVAGRIIGGVSSAAKGVATSIKTGIEEHTRKEREVKKAYEEARQRARIEEARQAGRSLRPETRREPSIGDLGKGSMGTSEFGQIGKPPIRYTQPERDFLGLSSGFQIGSINPMYSGFPLGFPQTPVKKQIIRKRYVEVPRKEKVIKNTVKISKVSKKKQKKKNKLKTEKYVKVPIRQNPPRDAATILGLKGYF